MSERLVCFLTGSTGFIGQEILRHLPNNSIVYALVRNPKKLEGIDQTNLGIELRWVEGDICDERIIFDADLKDKLKSQIDIVIHFAGIYDLNASHESLYTANVIGTRNLLNYINSFNRLVKFLYASTMAVSGNFKGKYTEEMFDVGQTFPNYYASTKYAAELEVRNWVTSVQKIIFRLGIVVGRSTDGWIPKIDGPYYLLTTLRNQKFLKMTANQIGYLALPFDEKARPAIVPVDEIAEAVALCCNRIKIADDLVVYHLMGPNGGLPIRNVLKAILKSAGYSVHLLPIRKSLVPLRLVKSLGLPDSALFYFYSRTEYAVRNFLRDYPHYKLKIFDDYASVVFSSEKNTQKKVVKKL